jgi:excisionase family DNA binding protein
MCIYVTHGGPLRPPTNSVNTDRRHMTKMLYRVNEAAEACSIGRTKTYQLINRGLLRSVRIDGAVRVPASALEEFVQTMEEKSRDSVSRPRG